MCACTSLHPLPYAWLREMLQKMGDHETRLHLQSGEFEASTSQMTFEPNMVSMSLGRDPCKGSYSQSTCIGNRTRECWEITNTTLNDHHYMTFEDSQWFQFAQHCGMFPGAICRRLDRVPPFHTCQCHCHHFAYVLVLKDDEGVDIDIPFPIVHSSCWHRFHKVFGDLPQAFKSRAKARSKPTHECQPEYKL